MLSNGQNGHTILFRLISHNQLLNLYSIMDDVGDDQSATLIYEIVNRLAEELNTTDNSIAAIVRLGSCVEEANNWSPELLRNNIFKAANLLGIELPSGMF